MNHYPPLEQTRIQPKMRCMQMVRTCLYKRRSQGTHFALVRVIEVTDIVKCAKISLKRGAGENYARPNRSVDGLSFHQAHGYGGDGLRVETYM